MHDLLDRLYDIGEQMREHLSGEDLEGFYGLISSRQELIQQINGASEKYASSPEFSEKFASLETQFNLIIEDLRIKEQAMFESLNQLQHLKQAHQSYNFDRQPRRFLRSNLSG